MSHQAAKKTKGKPCVLRRNQGPILFSYSFFRWETGSSDLEPASWTTGTCGCPGTSGYMPHGWSCWSRAPAVPPGQKHILDPCSRGCTWRRFPTSLWHQHMWNWPRCTPRSLGLHRDSRRRPGTPSWTSADWRHRRCHCMGHRRPIHSSCLPNHQRWHAKVEAQSEYVCTRCMHIFARLAPICTLSRCLLTKFLHWSSVGSLLRVCCCWLDNNDRSSLCSSFNSRYFFSNALSVQ